MSELVTVIIPVYEVEKYLTKCVDSVLSQTYKNLEIFLVDDGSPDNCGKICDDYAKKDKRVKVIHKENGGISTARNAALDACTGDYITFVDSDDWVEPTYIEELYNVIKKYDADMSVCISNYYNEKLELIRTTYKRKFDKEFYRDNPIDLFLCKGNLGNHAWSKLYKADIFRNVRFPDGINYEDMYIITDICANIKNGVALIQKPLYNYIRYRSGSITKDASRKKFDLILAKRKCIENVEIGSNAHKYACLSLFYDVYDYLYLFMKDDKILIKELLQYFKEDYKKYKKYIKFKTRIRYLIFKNFPSLYEKIWMRGRKK